MKQSLALCGLILLVAALSAVADENARDEEAIRKIESSWQEAWNHHDMKALSALVAEDVDFITVSGVWLKSREEFEAHHARLHGMQFKDSVWATTDTQIKFLKPDVALVHVRWGIAGDRDPDGTPRQPRRGIFTQVMVKHNGQWLILASQNTNIREPTPAK